MARSLFTFLPRRCGKSLSSPRAKARIALFREPGKRFFKANRLPDVPVEQQIQELERELAQVERVTRLTEAILAELMKASPPPANLEQARNFLRSARDLVKHGEQETAQQLGEQTRQALDAVRQWLAVADLGISPFFLRTHLEKNQLNGELQRALIHYFLRKQPHAENDRDKLDYLLAACFAATPPAQLAAGVEALFAGLPPREVGTATEVMRDELESLVARVADFTDFDQLVHARMVERARALKINLGEDFYHPRVLPTVIRFNLSFRKHFDQLLQQQLATVRQGVRQHFDQAWALTRAIEEACEKLALPRGARAGATPKEEAAPGKARLGRPLEGFDERPPIDRLVRRGEEPQKEHELDGIIGRLARFVEKLPPDQAKAEKVPFPLRDASLDLAPWEREAFVPAAAGAPLESARTIQYALGVTAWLEEELVRYERTRGDRYLWKTHFDLLSYAVVRAVDLLKAIRQLIRPDAPPAEAAWLNPLLQTALRLANTLNRVAPVFEAASQS